VTQAGETDTFGDDEIHDLVYGVIRSNSMELTELFHYIDANQTAFIARAVADRLRGHAVLGDGTVHRIVDETQTKEGLVPVGDECVWPQPRKETT